MNPKTLRPQAPIRVTVVEDNESYREHLRALIGGAPGFVCVGAHERAEEALRHLATERPAVVLLDLELPGLSGVKSIPQLRAKCPEAAILVLTFHDDPVRVFGALKAGAGGYLLKRIDPADLLNAIVDLHSGGAPMSSAVARQVIQYFGHRGQACSYLERLTSREMEIAERAARGDTPQQTAEALQLSIRTVHKHFSNIYQKLHISSQAQLVAKYHQGHDGH